MPVASAQVKSAILLAGLFAEGETIVHEPGPSRDHTERMLAEFQVEVKVEAEAKGAAVRLVGGQRLVGGGELTIPGDFSSAAFPLVAAAIVPGSDVRLTGVGVNPTRTGLYDLLVAMGAELRLTDDGRHGRHGARSSPRRPSSVVRPSSGQGEPLADLAVRDGPLRATEADGDLIVRAIDEFPIFAVAATQAEGTTVIREAAELRVKESDRIASVADRAAQDGRATSRSGPTACSSTARRGCTARSSNVTATTGWRWRWPSPAWSPTARPKSAAQRRSATRSRISWRRCRRWARRSRGAEDGEA